jgi:hypothetical protein
LTNLKSTLTSRELGFFMLFRKNLEKVQKAQKKQT